MQTLLAIDGGNSCIVFGIFEGENLQKTLRLSTSEIRGRDEYFNAVKDLFEKKQIDTAKIKRIGISSVVPGIVENLSFIAEDYFHLSPLIVSHKLDCGIKIDIEDPGELGPDLIASAVSGYTRFKSSVIIVDIGSATTFSYVSRDGVFQGVIICPGLRLCAESLQSRIPYLPPVDLRAPDILLGRNTIDSIQSGLIFGHASMIDGMIARMVSRFGAPAKIIACGGFTTVLKDCISSVDIFEPYLVLDGIRFLCDKNPVRGEKVL